MPYPTEVRIPIVPGTVDALRKLLVTFASGRTTLPVVFDDGTLGDALIDPDVIREWVIARKQGAYNDSQADEEAEEAEQAALQADIDALVAERT